MEVASVLFAPLYSTDSTAVAGNVTCRQISHIHLYPLKTEKLIYRFQAMCNEFQVVSPSLTTRKKLNKLGINRSSQI